MKKIFYLFALIVSGTAFADLFESGFESGEIASILGSVGDSVYADVNGNGVRDVGEPGVEGVEVTLTLPNGYQRTVATGTDGDYLFDRLAAGDYAIRVDASWVYGSDPQNTNDPDGNLDSSSRLTLSRGENRLDQDFGFRPLPPPQYSGRIEGDLYADLNNNGERDAGEASSIRGATVTLTLPGGWPTLRSGNFGSGSYSFSNLGPGDYQIRVDTSSVAGVGQNTGDPDGGRDSTSRLSLARGEHRIEQDFGFQLLTPPLGRISGRVDVKGHYTLGKAGVTLRANDEVLHTASISNAGTFRFEDLPAGVYTINVDTNDNTLAGFIRIRCDDDTNDDSSDGNSIEYQLAVGEYANGVNFCYQPPPSSLPVLFGEIGQYPSESWAGPASARSDDGTIIVIGQPRINTDNRDVSLISFYEQLPNGIWQKMPWSFQQQDYIAVSSSFSAPLAVDRSQVLLGLADANTVSVGSYRWNYLLQSTPFVGDERLPSPVLLSAEDGAKENAFGSALSLNGDRLAVGAHLDNTGGGQAGAVYLFRRDATEAWQPDGKLVSTTAAAGDFSGRALAMSGDWLLVGASLSDWRGSDSGSVIVYRLEGEVWQEQERLVADDTVAGDRFGSAIALSGNRLAISATQHDAAAADAGAVYLFELSAGGVWQQTEKLLADQPLDGERLGVSITLDGDRLAAAPLVSFGNARLFQKTNGAWAQTGTFFISSPAAAESRAAAVNLLPSGQLLVADRSMAIYGPAYPSDYDSLPSELSIQLITRRIESVSVCVHSSVNEPPPEVRRLRIEPLEHLGVVYSAASVGGGVCDRAVDFRSDADTTQSDSKTTLTLENRSASKSYRVKIRYAIDHEYYDSLDSSGSSAWRLRGTGVDEGTTVGTYREFSTSINSYDYSEDKYNLFEAFWNSGFAIDFTEYWWRREELIVGPGDTIDFEFSHVFGASNTEHGVSWGIVRANWVIEGVELID